MTTWPAHLPTKTVDVDIQGPGTVTFTGPVITVTEDNAVTLRVHEIVAVTAGTGSIVLPVTDAAGVLPADWQYAVTIRRGDQEERGTMELPAAATSPVKLTAQLQLGQDVQPGVTYIPYADRGVAGGVAALDVDGDVTDASGAKITGGSGGGAAPSGTVVSETSYGQTAAAGNATAYSRGNHTHGTPALPTAADVGAAALGHNHTGTYDPAGTATAAVAAHVAASDPHPQYLTAAEGAAAYQPLDADLTTIAGLTATTGNTLQAVAGAWASRTPAQARAALGVAGLIVLGAADPVPGGTPADTVIVRKPA